ncbi:lipopolysaccharide biosynthesis protein [Vibrio harveyi]
MNFKVLKSFTKFLSGNTLASILSLVNLSIISRYIGLEGFGYFILCQTAYLLAEQVFNIRGWQYYISQSKYEVNDIKKLYGINNSINIIAFLLSTSLAYISYLSVGLDFELYIGIVIYLSLILFRNYDSAYVVLRQRDMYGTLSMFNVALSASRLLAIYLMNSYLDMKFIDVVCVFVISEIIYFIFLNLYSSYLSGGYFSLFKFDSSTIKNGAEINLTTVFDLPVSTLDTYVVNYFFGAESVGIYKLIRKYVSILGRVVSPLNQVMFPEIVNVKSDKKINIVLKCMLVTFLICVSLGLSIYVSIFNFNLDFFSSIRDSDFNNIEFYFLSILGIEVLALTFSILNYLLVSFGKNVTNGKAVLLANFVFFIMLSLLSFLTQSLILATSVSLFLQVGVLIAYRLKVTFQFGA